MNTIYYLDLVKSEKSITSDYQLAKTLEISTSRVSNYRTGRYDMDELLALKIEKLLNLKTGTVLLDIQANRTKCPAAAKVFQELAQKLAAGALCLMLVVGGALPKPAQATGQIGPVNNNIHYAHKIDYCNRDSAKIYNLIEDK